MRVLSERSAISETKDPCGIRRTHLHHAFEIDQSGVYEIERQPNRRLQTRDPKRRLIKLERLLIKMMWRVIRCDRVDRSVFHRFEHGVDVFPASQRRTHLRI